MSNYPKTGDAKGSGEVATGLRMPEVTGPVGKRTEGFRFRTSAGPGDPDGIWYEIFYDVYLKSAGGSFQYEFRYFYRQVKWATPGGAAPRGTNGWGAIGPARELAPPSAPPPPSSIPAGTRLSGLNYTLSISLPLRGSSRPLTQTPVSPTDPVFGWRGTGAGTSQGTPRVGDGAGSPSGPFPTRNPFGYSVPANQDRESGSTGEVGSETSEPGDATDDDPYNNPGPPIPGFTKGGQGRKTEWNPPPIRTITGAYIPVVYDWEGNSVRVDETESETRQSLLGYGSYASRVANKGRIIQWIQFENEWRATAGSVTNEKGEVTDTWDEATPIVPNKKRYGFRFTYNPSEVQFQMSPVPGLDPGVIISGIGRSFPMGDEDGGSISLTTYLNRIEDMAFIRKSGDGFALTSGVNPYGDKKLSPFQLQGIATRGTGIDLEFLFRTTLGRPFPTPRGMTADIGLILGLPLLLQLGGGMSYTGRLTGLSYTHMYFTADMVPTFTQVSMTFTRFPDATSFNEVPNPGDGGNGKNKPGTKGGNNSRPGAGNRGGRGSGGRTGRNR